MKLILKVPPDASLLSSTLYEGVAFVLKVSQGSAGPGWIEVPDDALAKAFEEILRLEGGLDGIREKIRLPMVGNDLKHKLFNPLFEALGIKPSVKVTNYGAIIAEIAEAAEKNPEKLKRSGTIEIKVRLSNKEILVGPASDAPFLKLSLFKSCDRYSSFGIAEYVSLGETVRQSVSLTTTLLCLLGIYSSYIGRVYNTNFFLFLDPSEIANALSASALRKVIPSKMIGGILRAKNLGKDLIFEFLHAALIPSAVLTSVALNVELAKVLEDTNLDVLRMRLIRVDVEGGQTYKVYSSIPIEARRDPLVMGELAEELFKHVAPASSPLVECAKRFVVKGLSKGRKLQLCEENDFILKAIDSLYRFVALKDPVALAEYVRHLRDSISVLDAALASGNATRNSSWRRDTYSYWISRLEHVLASITK